MASKKKTPENTPHLIHTGNGKKPSRLEGINARLDELKLKQQLYYEQETAKPEIAPIRVDANRQRIGHHSDWHIGHPASEVDPVKEAFENALTKDGQSLNFYDDPTDGSKPGGSGDHDATTDQPAQMKPGKQFLLWGDMMTELDENGRLGAVVDGTLQHTSWIKALGFNPYDFVPGLRGKVIDNGGVVTYKYPDGEEEKIIGYHNAGGGGSVQNPLAANKLRLAEHDEDGSTVVSGHNHGRYGFEQHVDKDGKIIFTGIACGTVKGIDPKHKDPFLEDKAVKSKGAGVITTHVEIDGERTVIPTLTQKQSDMIWDGYDLLELTEKNGMTREVIEEMKDRLHDEAPRYTFERFGPNDSRVQPDHSKNGPRTKHWTRAVYNTERTKMPIQVHFVNGLRAGHSTSDMELLKKTVIEQAKNDPHVAIVFLRKLIAEDVPGSPNRAKVVKELLDNLKDVPGILGSESGNLKSLGVLYDAVLRDPKWKLEVGPTYTEKQEEKFGKLLAASKIEEELGVPMLANHGEIVIETAAGNYSIAVHDKLGQTGSMEKPFNGLYAQERRHILQGGDPHDVVTGGHMPVAGIRVTGGVKKIGEQTMVAPGGYAEWIEKSGTGDAQMPSAPGQSVIFTTRDEKNVFPAANFQHSEERMKVLSLEEGARQTGGVDQWEKKLGRRKRTHFTSR